MLLGSKFVYIYIYIYIYTCVCVWDTNKVNKRNLRYSNIQNNDYPWRKSHAQSAVAAEYTDCISAKR